MITRNEQNGFTIVELLIVIVVIGILAAIVIVAYNGISTQANNTAKINELKSLQKLFEAHKALNGKYPQDQLTSGRYCLSTGFPNAGSPGVPSCYLTNITTNSIYSYPENDATAVAIRDDLSTVGKVPAPVIKHSANSVMGPIALYYPTAIYLITVIKGETINDCPSGTIRTYPADQAALDSQNGRLECSIALTK